jgi:MFS family permease
MLSRDKKNVILNTLAETGWGFQANMVIPATVLTVLLCAYGASARMIGAIAAIEIAGILLPQLLGAYIFTSRKRLQIHLIEWHIALVCIVLLAMGAVVWGADSLSPVAFRWVMLGCFIVSTIGVGVIVAVWMDWQAEIFDRNIRGTVFGIALFGSAFAGAGGALLSGWIVRSLPSPLSYACLYLSAGAISIVAILLFALIDDPAVHQEDVVAHPRFGDLVGRFHESLMDKNFRAYLVGRILASCGFAIMPFIALHYRSVEGGSLAAGTIVSCGSAMSLGMAIGSLLLGRLGDRHGHRLGVLIGVGGQILSLVVLVLLPGLVGCVVAYLGAGICAPGTWVSHCNLILETCPHEHRVAHIAVGNLVLGGATFFLPLLAGVVAERFGTIVLFEFSIVFSVIAFLWFALKVKDPRETQDVPLGPA